MSNKSFYSFIAFGVIALFVAGFFIVNALTPGIAPNPGHLITEVAPPAGCADGQVLGWSGSSWSCVHVQAKLGVYDCGDKAITKIDFTTGTVVCKDVTGVTSTQFDLVYGIHSSTQCTNLGGTVITDGADKLCKFNQASCKTGWTPFKEWSTTTSNSITCHAYWFHADEWGEGDRCRKNAGGDTTCNTGSHQFKNLPLESCQARPTGVYADHCDGCTLTYVEATATRTQIGCY